MTTVNAVGNGLSGTTGSGTFVGATSPTLVTPAIGTPSSGTLTNCTGLPISGIASLGTGVATALGQSVTGSGGIALATSPSFTTPTLGAANATSINFGASTLSTYASTQAWTPAVTFATAGDLNVSYATQQGIYTAIGTQYFFNFILVFTPTYTTASGQFRISGLPHNAVSASFGSCVASGITFDTGYTEINTCAQAGVSYLVIFETGSNKALSSFSTTTLPTGVQYTLEGQVALFG